MSDDPQKPALPAPATDPARKKEDDVKTAVPAGRGELPVSQQLTIGQHVFIWTMVIIVGVIFGAGASFGLLQQPARKVGKEDEGDVSSRQQVAQKLERILNADGNPYRPLFALPEYDWTGRNGNAFEGYSRELTESRIAASEGLMPARSALDLAVERFLDTPLPAARGAAPAGRTYRDALRDHQSSRDGVTMQEVKRFVQEREARAALRARGVVPAAVPLSFHDDVQRLGRPDYTGQFSGGDQVELTEVVLSAEHLLPVVGDDDPELATTYERLRAERFTRKASATVTVAAADPEALAATMAVTDAEIAAGYEADKETYRKPPAPPVPPAVADPKAPPEYKPLAEVSAQVKSKLQRTKAEARARELADAFIVRVDELGLDQKDDALFRAEAEKAGLKIENAVVEEPARGMLQIGGRSVKDVLRLFDKERTPGFVSRAVATEAKGWLVLRMSERREAGFQDLAAVKPQVKQILAGRRAYPALLEQAKAARAAAQELGFGGLAKWIASDAAKAWKAGPLVSTAPLARELNAPPTEANGPAGDKLSLASLALAARPVALVAGAAGDVPSVKLVQAGALKLATLQEDVESQKRFAGIYRDIVGSYRERLFSSELNAKLEAR